MVAGLKGIDRRRLRWVLALFFTALAVPAALLVADAYGRLKWETLHQYQTLAEELSGRIDRRFAELVEREEARSYADYGFVVVAGKGTYLRRSPLSELSTADALPGLPGLVGYFQVDAEGRLSTPLLPDATTPSSLSRLDAQELQQRRDLRDEIQGVLGRNRLVHAAPPAMNGGRQEQARATRQATGAKEDRELAPADSPVPESDAEVLEETVAVTTPQAQANFDLLELDGLRRLKTGGRDSAGATQAASESALDDRVGKLAKSAPYTAQAKRERAYRKERILLPELEQRAQQGLKAEKKKADAADEAVPALLAAADPELRVRIFESEIDPFSLSLLDSGHFVLFRKVWRDGSRDIQGLLIERDALLHSLVEEPFRQSSLAPMSSLAVLYGGERIAGYAGNGGRKYLSSNRELSGTLLQRARLSAPAASLELVFSVQRLPAGPGAAVVVWLATALVLVLCAGFYLLYRLGLRQIAVTAQQQDFVSAVSHELKTPLTSIRMYGEMLREGWANEERRQTYYEYICTESERLTRLIGNVLQLARLTRNELAVDLQTLSLGELMGRIGPKLSTQAEAAGFTLVLQCSEHAGARVRVDEDSLTQVLINLVDNALKFARDAKHREVLIACTQERRELCIGVRDFGPGIPLGQLRKIFRLFYRAGSELTRETVGTGIGLALVRELMQRMGGRVDAVNREPGAELRLYLARIVEK